MDHTLQILSKAEALEALNRSEVDVQIATAKQYPRNVAECVKRIVALSTLDDQTAEECFYSLRRKGRDGSTSVIEGPSIRLAEIVATSWSNLRVQSQIIGNDGKNLTARGICHDLETNVAISMEVRRSICDKHGRPYSEDMQIVTGNAAAAIALRNAIFKVVPKAVISSALTAIKDRAKGNADDLDIKKQNMVAYFAKLGVTKEMICHYLEIDTLDKVDMDMVVELRGVKNSIKEGVANVRDLFIEPYNKSLAEKGAQQAASDNKSRIQEAMKKQAEAPAQADDIRDLPLE